MAVSFAWLEVGGRVMNEETLMIALRIAAEEAVTDARRLGYRIVGLQETDTWLNDTVARWLREARNE